MLRATGCSEITPFSIDKSEHQIIAELESIQRHLKREYEKELDVDCLGHTYHVECLEHCLPYAFGE
ncbi:4277_t:CDS:2, partial [Entrophospora sp. SA101]